MAEGILEVINPPNVLKEKVGTDGPGAIDLEPWKRLKKSSLPWPTVIWTRSPMTSGI